MLFSGEVVVFGDNVNTDIIIPSKYLTILDPFEIAMLIQEIYSEVMRTVGSGLQEIGLTHQQIMIIKLIAHNHNKEINISEICKEMSLTKGTITDNVAICPRHQWEYDLDTGKCLNHDSLPLKQYGVKVEGEDVMVSMLPMQE